MDLQPELRSGSASSHEDAIDSQAMGRGVLEDVPSSTSGRFINPPNYVTRTVCQRQPGDKPRAIGFFYGERFPCQSSRTTNPSAAGGTAAASSSSTWKTGMFRFSASAC